MKDENKEVANVKKAKAEKGDAPVEKEVSSKATAAKAPDAKSEKAPKEAPTAVVLKSASDPAVKEKADALLGKTTAREKAPHPRVGKTEGQKAPKD